LVGLLLVRSGRSLFFNRGLVEVHTESAARRPESESGVGRLRLDPVIGVVGNLLTANHDRISSPGVIVRPADDYGADATFKGNKATGDVISSARDGGIEIVGRVSAPASDAAVVADGDVARTPADAGEPARGAAFVYTSDITVPTTDAVVGWTAGTIKGSAADYYRNYKPRSQETRPDQSALALESKPELKRRNPSSRRTPPPGGSILSDNRSYAPTNYQIGSDFVM
jgi:hypothetical protein